MRGTLLGRKTAPCSSLFALHQESGTLNGSSSIPVSTLCEHWALYLTAAVHLYPTHPNGCSGAEVSYSGRKLVEDRVKKGRIFTLFFFSLLFLLLHNLIQTGC